MSEWICCKDQLPKENGTYLVFHTKNKFGKGEEGYKLIRWRLSTNPKNAGLGFWGNCDRFFNERITHWMLITKPNMDVK